MKVSGSLQRCSLSNMCVCTRARVHVLAHFCFSFAEDNLVLTHSTKLTVSFLKHALNRAKIRLKSPHVKCFNIFQMGPFVSEGK